MIERPAADDPLTPARLALRAAWCGSAPMEHVFDPPRFVLTPGGPVLDESAAARALLDWARPVRVRSTFADGVLTIEPLELPPASGRARAGPRPPLPPQAATEPEARRILAWTAGRGLVVSYQELLAATREYMLEAGGFAATYDRRQFDEAFLERFGMDLSAAEGIEYLVLAGRQLQGGDRRGFEAPIRRSPAPDG